MTGSFAKAVCASIALWVLALGVAGCGNKEGAQSAAETAADAGPRVYGVRSGRITYVISGLQDGVSTAQWDQWGLRESETLTSKMSFGGVETNANQLSIRTPESLVLIDMDSKTATRVPNPIQEFIASSTTESGEDLGEQWLAQMGGERQGTDKVAGKTCDLWTVPRLGGSLCIWKGLMLRQQVEKGGVSFLKVATKIETDIEIDQKDLELPEGLTFAESPTP